MRTLRRWAEVCREMTSTTRNEPGGRTRIRALGLGALAVAFWLAVWHVAAAMVGRDFLLASPWQVVARLVELAPTLEFWRIIGWSLARIAIGFAGAAVVGGLLAVGAAASSVIKALIAPAISAIRSAPVVSFIILLLLWTDSSRLPVFTAFLMVLPVMYATLSEGIAHRDKALLEMAAVFNVGWLRRVWAVDVPAVAPYAAAASRAGVGLAWKAGVAAEVIGVATGSIGEQMYMAKVFLNSADLFAWTVVIVTLSVLCERLVLLALRRVPGGDAVGVKR